MESENLNDDLILNSLGALENGEKIELEKILNSADSKLKKVSGIYDNLMVLINKSIPVEKINDTESIKNRILQKINETSKDS